MSSKKGIELTALDLKASVKTIEGKDVLTQMAADKEPVPLTVQAALRMALTTNFADEPNVSGDAKFLRYAIARRIYEADKTNVKLSDEEGDILRTCIGKAWGIEVIGHLYDLLNKK